MQTNVEYVCGFHFSIFTFSTVTNHMMIVWLFAFNHSLVGARYAEVKMLLLLQLRFKSSRRCEMKMVFVFLCPFCCVAIDIYRNSGLEYLIARAMSHILIRIEWPLSSYSMEYRLVNFHSNYMDIFHLLIGWHIQFFNGFSKEIVDIWRRQEKSLIITTTTITSYRLRSHCSMAVTYKMI